MSRGPFVPLAPFFCHKCKDRLGWTTPGEARRINDRAHVYCDNHSSTPAELTERQVEYLKAAGNLRVSGVPVTYGAVAEALGISRSRSSQIAMSIRARGYGNDLDQAFGVRGAAPVVEHTAAGLPTPDPEPAPVEAPTPTPAPVARFVAAPPSTEPEFDPAAVSSDDAFVV